MKYIVLGYGDLADKRYNGGWKSGIHLPKIFDTLQSAYRIDALIDAVNDLRSRQYTQSDIDKLSRGER